MQQRLLPLVAFLASAGLAQAQAPVSTTPEGRTAPNPAGVVGTAPSLPCLPGACSLTQQPFTRSCLDTPGFVPGPNSTAPQFWAQADYLMGWVNNGRPLMGQQGPDPGPFSGVRMTVGSSLVPSHSFGVEGSGLFLDQRSTGSSLFSHPAGNPALPFATPGRP